MCLVGGHGLGLGVCLCAVCTRLCVFSFLPCRREARPSLDNKSLRGQAERENRGEGRLGVGAGGEASRGSRAAGTPSSINSPGTGTELTRQGSLCSQVCCQRILYTGWAVSRHSPGGSGQTSPHLQMPSQPAMLLGGLLLLVATMTAAQRRGQEAGGRRQTHRVQYGQCSYTFVLPEPEPCPPEPDTFGASNSLQRDLPDARQNLGDWRAQRVQQLEKMLENNTQWLQKVRQAGVGRRFWGLSPTAGGVPPAKETGLCAVLTGLGGSERARYGCEAPQQD
jgi:hypothetical protein